MIQIPLELTKSWTILVVDVLRILDCTELFPEDYCLDGAHALKSFTFSSEIKVRGIFTSDNFYTWNKLPLDFQFKAPAGADKKEFEKQFVWTCIPSVNPELIEQYLKESSPLKPHASEDSQEDDTNSMFRNSELEERKLPIDEYEDSKQIEKKQYADHTMTKSELGNLASGSGKTEEKGDKQVNFEEESKISHARNGNKSEKLAVDPILKMDYVIGYTGKNLKWSPDKEDKSIVYPSGGLLVSLNVRSNKQRFFYGHTDMITCFNFSQDGTLLASGQEGKRATVRIWDFETGKIFSVLYPKLKTVECISFNCNKTTLAVSGRDEKNKECIFLWDISTLNASTKPPMITKQLSNFNIMAMKFSPIDPFVLMSCGRENIRSWRLKNKHLQGCSVVLDHRARNTVFTDLDYEFGFKSSDLVENESLSRILISSKTGLIMIINYHSKKLENAFQIHDGPILSISVNEAFCVTGSEDNLLRVWLLDFSEYFIEAPHDGAVSAVDISPDGTQIVCGTNNGSLGMVDIGKEKYVTLLRSHSDEILSADYNIERNYIITISKDKTIRLWGVDGNFQKIYEFVSPHDQAISVSSHPSLPLFACGFESGSLRIFDIENTKVREVYSQFNLPLVDLTYSPDSRLLLTASKDGYLAIHNVALQHQPIKMIQVDFPPPHVSLGFDPTSSVFAAFGDGGNYVNVYDTVNFSLMNTVTIKKDVGKCLVFSPAELQLIVATTSNKIRFYDLKIKNTYTPLREITNIHRDGINSLNFSKNGQYFITAGEDRMIKIFDSDIDKISPYYFQSFIGHTFPVKKAFFNNNNQCFSIGGRDGIHMWTFRGDVSENYENYAEDLLALKNKTQEMMTYKGKPKEAEVEEIEDNKEDKEEDIDKENVNSENIDQNSQKDLKDTDSKQDYKEYKETDIQAEGDDFIQESQGPAEAEGEDKYNVNGLLQENEPPILPYNGSNVQDNIIWIKEKGIVIYTSENNIIVQNGDDNHRVLEDGYDGQRLSALAISPDHRLLAS